VTKGLGKDKHAFGARHERFTYFPDQRRDGSVSPISYKLKDAFCGNSTYNTSSRFSFGTSRVAVKKIFVEEIIGNSAKKVASPSPDTYEKDKSFGKTGIHYTFSPRRDRTGLRSDRYDPRHFRGQKDLPGPGSYN
jgi:hypothetical protein